MAGKVILFSVNNGFQIPAGHRASVLRGGPASDAGVSSAAVSGTRGEETQGGERAAPALSGPLYQVSVHRYHNICTFHPTLTSFLFITDQKTKVNSLIEIKMN